MDHSDKEPDKNVVLELASELSLYEACRFVRRELGHSLLTSAIMLKREVPTLFPDSHLAVWFSNHKTGESHA